MPTTREVNGVTFTRYRREFLGVEWQDESVRVSVFRNYETRKWSVSLEGRPAEASLVAEDIPTLKKALEYAASLILKQPIT